MIQNNWSPQLLSPMDQFIVVTAVLFCEWMLKLLENGLL